MSARREALRSIDGVGEATAARIEAVIAETGPDVEAALEALDDATDELTRAGGGGDAARVDRARPHIDTAVAVLRGTGER